MVVAIRQQTCFSPALCSPPWRLNSQAHTPNAVSHPAPRYDEYSPRHSCGSVWQPSFTLTIPSLRQFRRSPEAGCVPWADAAAVRHGPLQLGCHGRIWRNGTACQSRRTRWFLRPASTFRPGDLTLTVKTMPFLQVGSPAGSALHPAVFRLRGSSRKARASRQSCTTSPHRPVCIPKRTAQVASDQLKGSRSSQQQLHHARAVWYRWHTHVCCRSSLQHGRLRWKWRVVR